MYDNLQILILVSGAINTKESFDSRKEYYNQLYQVYMEVHKALQTNKNHFRTLQLYMNDAKDEAEMNITKRKIKKLYAERRSKVKSLTKHYSDFHTKLQEIRSQISDYVNRQIG